MFAVIHQKRRISVDDFVDKLLDKGSVPVPDALGPDPDKVYCGDPRLETVWGCNLPVIINACARLLDPLRYSFSASFGKTLGELCREYIDRGIPVIIWCTVGMRDGSAPESYAHWTTPEGKHISYNRYLHAMLLVGYDEDFYYFNDPMRRGEGANYTGYPKSESERAFEVMGMQSAAVCAGFGG